MRREDLRFTIYDIVPFGYLRFMPRLEVFTHHASRITHHASRITHHASRSFISGSSSPSS
ncbi:MAG: hypothetical protein HC875_06990 [Anaerolineales bacterium]|nr:hypothetical protein [Anaerolineales bacterium]